MIPVIVGVVIAIFAFLIFVGGVSRIASVTVRKLCRSWQAFIFLGALIVIFVNITEIPHAFAQIVVGAFSPGAALGGGSWYWNSKGHPVWCVQRLILQ